MPYIAQKDREKFDALRILLRGMPPLDNKGELEYVTYLLMLKFMSSRENKYTPLHEAVYAPVHAAHEFERHFLDKRENDAEQKNGHIEL